jgi:D-glucosaminate-6-phosphate ammonia-lyase
LIESARLNAAPFQGLARPMKVGKEEICGLLAAVERYVKLDHEDEAKSWGAVVGRWADGLSSLPGISVQQLATNEAGQPVPRLEIAFENIERAVRVVTKLWEGDPRVAVLQLANKLYLSPDTLLPGESGLVLQRMIQAIGDYDLS